MVACRFDCCKRSEPSIEPTPPAISFFVEPGGERTSMPCAFTEECAQPMAVARVGPRATLQENGACSPKRQRCIWGFASARSRPPRSLSHALSVVTNHFIRRWDSSYNTHTQQHSPEVKGRWWDTQKTLAGAQRTRQHPQQTQHPARRFITQAAVALDYGGAAALDAAGFVLLCGMFSMLLVLCCFVGCDAV